MGHADGPLVVLNYEKDGQLPELRHVEALKELAVVASSIAEESRCDGIAAGITKGIALVAAGKGGSQRNGNPLSDEGETSQKMVFLREQVHRATATLAATCFLAKQLAHDLTGWNTGAQGVYVVAVGAAEPVVLALHGADDTRAHSLLAVVQMHESKHLAAVIHLRALVFKASSERHVPVKHQTRRAIHRGSLCGDQTG